MNGGRRPTRSGEAVSSRSNSGLMIGGLIAGVVAVIALVAVIANSGGGTKKDRPREEKRISVADMTPRSSSGPSAPARTRNSPASRSKPLDKARSKPRKPMSYYRQFVDMGLWKEAKGYADEAEKLLRDLDRGEIPAGMNKKKVRTKAKDLLHRAVDKGAEFMSPLDNRREEAEHFIAVYEDVMMRWQRKTRSLVFGSKN